MKLEPTEGAADPVAFLPELVTGMASMLACKRTVQTWTVDVLGEGLFVDPLVDTGAAFGALQIAFGLFKAVSVSGLILTCLCL